MHKVYSSSQLLVALHFFYNHLIHWEYHAIDYIFQAYLWIHLHLNLPNIHKRFMLVSWSEQSLSALTAMSC